MCESGSANTGGASGSDRGEHFLQEVDPTAGEARQRGREGGQWGKQMPGTGRLSTSKPPTWTASECTVWRSWRKEPV